MGRIDDAMRRAALEAEDPATRTGKDASEAAVGDESFPLELSPTPDEPVSATAAEDTALVQQAAPRAQVGRLIDTLDRRLTGKLVADNTMPVPSREQYRRLAATLHHAQVDHGLKVVMIA